MLQVFCTGMLPASFHQNDETFGGFPSAPLMRVPMGRKGRGMCARRKTSDRISLSSRLRTSWIVHVRRMEFSPPALAISICAGADGNSRSPAAAADNQDLDCVFKSQTLESHVREIIE